MSVAFAPALAHKVRRLRGVQPSFRATCEKSWEVHPPTIRWSPPAIFHEGDLERVTACQEHTDHSIEWARIRGGKTSHGATIAYRLRRAVLHRGFIYTQDTKLPLESHRESYDMVVKAPQVTDATLACSLFGNRFFGHFVTDDLPLNVLAASLGEPVRTAQPDTPHQAEYRELGRVSATPMMSASFGFLTVFDDFGQNDGKRARYERLRALLRSTAAVQPATGVYLVRGETGVSRRLVNEESVAALLLQRGFRILRPEHLNVSEIVDALSSASIVVGVEGSQLAHAVMSMPERGTVVALQPPYRFNNVYKDYTDCLGMQYGFVVGHAAAGGFSIDGGELSALLDRAEVVRRND